MGASDAEVAAMAWSLGGDCTAGAVPGKVVSGWEKSVAAW